MSSNTFVKAQKEVINDAIKELVDSSVFLGVTSYVVVLSRTQAQGTNYGYNSGGLTTPADPTTSGGITNSIQKFPFSSDANTVDVANLTAVKYASAGQSSSTHGYTSGGSPSPEGNVIDKFTFATDANAVDIADLAYNGRYGVAGQSSTTHGYTSGGGPPGNVRNYIDKFPFTSDTNASDVGDLAIARTYVAGQSSTENGYTSGGTVPTTTAIQKFPFASDTNASIIGYLSNAKDRFGAAGQNSLTHGYTSGGFDPPILTRIDKFPFASDTNATYIADLTVARYYAAGQSSEENGYTSAGIAINPGGSGRDTMIDKFPFASDANASDVGDLTFGNQNPAGQQY